MQVVGCSEPWCSWGVSKVGRVAQRIDPTKGYLYSEFDTSLFSLTVIPILGWFKLLPTFGGCVVTAHVRGQPTGLLKLMSGMAARSIRKDYAALKALLEG